MAFLYALSLPPACQEMQLAVANLDAKLASGILNAIGQGNHLHEATLYLGGHIILTVLPGCAALEFVWFLSAAIIASHAAFPCKMFGIIVGITLLFLLNVIRIVSLYVVGVRFPAFFEMLHREIWPGIFNLATIFLLVGWLVWAKRGEYA